MVLFFVDSGKLIAESGKCDPKRDHTTYISGIGEAH
jgi:hypothetical protein